MKRILTLFGLLLFFLREGSALLFAALIWYILWGGFSPLLDTPERAFQMAVYAGLIAIAYLSLQAFTVVTQPLGRETRYLLDLLLSLVPLAIIGYAATQYLNGQQTFSYFQVGVMWLFGAVSAMDVFMNSWFSLKLNKLASDFVSMS